MLTLAQHPVPSLHDIIFLSATIIAHPLSHTYMSVSTNIISNISGPLIPIRHVGSTMNRKT